MLLRSIVVALCFQLGFCAMNISERTFIKIDAANGFRSCVRLTSASGQMGCTSPSGGAHGVVIIVNSSAKLDWVMKTGTNGPFIPLLPQSYFTLENMKSFHNNDRISGALVLADATSAGSGRFSPDKKCPNAGFGLYKEKNCTWNPAGNSLLYEDFDYPIFTLLKGSETDRIINCATNYSAFVNGGAGAYPLCSATMDDFMYAVRDTFTCMTQSTYGGILGAVNRCDPLKGFNVWGTLAARNGSEKYNSREIIMVVTRLDAKGFFNNLAPGAETSAGGLTAILAVLDALRTAPNREMWGKKVVFAVFNGESFDYIGSSRMVWDMKTAFPAKLPTGDDVFAPATFNLSNVKTIIELGQVGLSATPNDLFMHYDRETASTTTLRASLRTAGSGRINLADGPGRLPPASSQMFLREDKAIEVVVIADHSKNFTNKYYNSYLDDAANLNVKKDSEQTASVVQLTQVATTVARALATLAGETSTATINARTSYVHDLAVCFTTNFSCPLVVKSFPATTTVSNSYRNSRYIGINSAANNWLVNAVYRLAAQSIGRTNATLNSSDTCKAPAHNTLENYLFMRVTENGTDGRCVIGPVYRHSVKSPAFEDPVDYRSTVYSTWTESVWSTISMKLYLKSSPKSGNTALGVGITVFVTFLLLVIQINRVSGELFFVPRPL